MKTSIMKVHIIFLLLLILPSAVFAQNSGTAFPRLEPDPQALEYFARGDKNHNYSWADLAEISLWASSGSVAAPQLEQIKKATETLRTSADLPADPKEKAEYILRYMHKNFLKSYALTQTRVDTMLISGRYNCVSSAVLYMILCMSAGLDVIGVMTKDHAFATVRIGGENIDVETTNPYGFDPGNRKEFHDQFGTVTGFAYVSPRNYRDRQSISPIELVSLILSNRIAEAEKANRFADAVPLAIDRAALLVGSSLATHTDVNPQDAFFDAPERDVMDRIFNFGASLLRAGKEEDCLRWATLAAPRYPNEKRWQEFTLAAVNNRAGKLIKANNATEARKFLDSQKQLLSDKDYATLDTMVLDADLLTSANKIRTAADSDTVLDAIVQAQTSGRLPDKRAVELLTFSVQKAAASLCAPPGRDWLAAINYIENNLKRFGPNRELEQAVRTYQSNRAGDFHNRFAAAWNKKNFDEALQILNDGLKEFPTDKQLLSDQNTVKKNMP